MSGDRLPETIYVKREADKDDPECTWLLAEESPVGLGEREQHVPAGEYRLVRYVRVVNATTVEPADDRVPPAAPQEPKPGCIDCGDPANPDCDNGRCSRHCDERCDTHCDRSLDDRRDEYDALDPADRPKF